MIFFDKIELVWIVCDTLLGEGSPDFELYLHLNPGVSQVSNMHPGNCCLVGANGSELQVRFAEGSLSDYKTKMVWVSNGYGTRIESVVLYCSCSGTRERLGTEIRFVPGGTGGSEVAERVESASKRLSELINR